MASEWSLDSSPPGATVDFGDDFEVDTTATFYEPGEYVLELTAGDDLVTAEDTVTITIRQLPLVEAGEYEPITLPVNFVDFALFDGCCIEIKAK